MHELQATQKPASADCPTIITNNHFRPVIYGYDLTEKEREEFDYLEGDDLDCASFIKYKDCIYHLGDVMRVDPNQHFPMGFNKYDGYVSETFFSGVLFELSEDCESVKCARYYS